MAHERKICIFTGSRAEYSAVYNLIRQVAQSDEARLHLLVAASHWAPEFGSTHQDIVEDGFRIDSRVEMVLSSDTEVGIVKSMGVGLISFADVLGREQPDILVVAGDRYETLAVVQAAYVLGIPVAHIGGGEVTGGSLDEGFRHAITKMAKLHFVASDLYARRVRQLGERPETVFVVGPPALEDLLRLEPAALEGLSDQVGLMLVPDGFALCTYHATGVPEGDALEIRGVLDVLEQQPGLQVVFTSSNADAAGRDVNRQVREWCRAHAARATFVSSLGRRGYHSLLRHSAFVLGNSSSGLIEAPAAGVPTVNVGDRQAGRYMEPSVIQCSADVASIETAVQAARSPRMRVIAQECRQRLGQRHTSQLILRALIDTPDSQLGRKQFVDQATDE